jgi:hypothetical protein
MSCTPLVRSSEANFKLALRVVETLSAEFQFDADAAWDKVCSSPVAKMRHRFRRAAKKARRDLNVRGPYSSYLLFSMDVRPRMRTENATASITDISKLISAEWEKLPEAKKTDYKTRAREDRDRYNREKAAALERVAAEQPAEVVSETVVPVASTPVVKAPRASKASKTPTAPATTAPATTAPATAPATTAPATAPAKGTTSKGSFKVYQTQKRASLEKKNPTSKKSEVTKMLSDAWGKLSTSQQAKFVQTTA